MRWPSWKWKYGAVWLYGWVVLEKELQSSIVICFERLRFEGFAGPRVATWWVNRCLPKEKAGSSPLPNKLKIDTFLAGKGWINFLHWDMSIYKYINQWTSILYCMYAVHMFICTYYILIMCISCMYIYYMYITLLQFHRTTSSPHHFLADHVCWVSPTTSGSSTKAKAAKAQATLKSKPPKHPTVALKFPRLYHWGNTSFSGNCSTTCPGCCFLFFYQNHRSTIGFYRILLKSLPKRLLDPSYLNLPPGNIGRYCFRHTSLQKKLWCLCLYNFGWFKIIYLFTALLVKGSKWRCFSNDRVCNEHLCSTAKKMHVFFFSRCFKWRRWEKSASDLVAFCFHFCFFPYPQIQFFKVTNIRPFKLKKRTRKTVCVAKIRESLWKSLISEGKWKLPVCFGWVMVYDFQTFPEVGLISVSFFRKAFWECDMAIIPISRNGGSTGHPDIHGPAFGS